MTQSVEEESLETLVDPLAKTSQQFERDTIQHSDQLTTERRINLELRDIILYTADYGAYTVEDNEVILYLGRIETNPIFNNIEEAIHELMSTGNYILDKDKNKDDIEAIKNAESTLRVKLSDLELRRSNSGWYYFEIDTANYDSLNKAQREVAERIYGQGDDFIKNMKIFNKAGIGKTRFYVLDPDYVKQETPQDGALVRATRLYDFKDRSNFYAIVRNVQERFGLRGVLNAA